ncbi:MAG: CDGSH iron-sulfur domain-containing protein [Caldilineales bacterium]
MINTHNQPMRHSETVAEGKTAAFCRCWQSAKFPHCDGTHKQINAETGDNVGPVIVTGGAAAEEA